MKAFAKKLSLMLAFMMLATMLVACNGHTFAEDPSKLVEAKNFAAEAQKPGVVVVDMQSEEDYAAGHVVGAVNIPSSDIVISVPVPNMLTTSKKLAKLMGKMGISNDTQILVYDSDRMSAARFLWTMLMYGNENVRVVNGGVEALKAAGVAMDTSPVTPEKTSFETGEPRQNWLATTDDVLAQVNNPDPNVVLLDVRSMEEYMEGGKIPTAILMNYTGNYYSDNTLKSVQATRINYMQAGIFPENEIIIYCKTSFRAAPVFLALYEAGYRNLRIYDGAWLEWTSVSDRPVEMPEGAAVPVIKDAS